MPAHARAAVEVRRDADDHFEVILNRTDDRPISILQVTDLHLGKMDFWKQDLTTCRRVRRLVETHHPDMIVITGDLLTGEKYFGSLLAAYAVDFFDSLKTPWLYAFGNHDPEGGYGRDQIFGVFATAQWGVLGHHPVTNQWLKKYDYVVDVKRAPQGRPDWQVYGFDSGSEKGFKSIKEDQLAWFAATADRTKQRYGRVIPAVTIFHIPLREFQELWDDAGIQKVGERREKVSFEEDDGSPYRAFVRAGNIKAVFCGHDHFNNYWGRTKEGIVLSYGYISGEATHYAWPTGGKLIRLPMKGGSIAIENVTPVFTGNSP